MFPFRNFTIDHVVPQSRGGTDHLDNLQLLCGACKSLKGDRPLGVPDGPPAGWELIQRETMDTGAAISTMIIGFLSLVVSVILAGPQLLRNWRRITACCRLRGLVSLLDEFIYGNPNLEHVGRLRNELDKLDIPHPHLPQFDLRNLEVGMFYAYLRGAACLGNLDKARAAYREAKKADEETDKHRLNQWREEHGLKR